MATHPAGSGGGQPPEQCLQVDRERGRIWLTVEPEREQVVVRVRDTGIGIAAEQISRIFEMFAQAKTPLESSRGGLGIGLTLVKNLVELTAAQSKPEAPASVKAVSSLSVCRCSPGCRPWRRSLPLAQSASTHPRRVLVVDDNRDSSDSLATLLKLTGHDVYIANDGLEAVEAAAMLQPDVILLDIGMPRLNGYDAARRIREQPRRKALTLVALTGWGQAEDRRRSEDAGFDAHLVKPVDLVALTKLLDESGGSQQNAEG